MIRVFIDGSAGTTGLRIFERLGCRKDVELLSIPEEHRKDPAVKKEYFNNADIVFLCLPDAAAIESAALVENPDTVVIDTSTAHRTAEGWTYGFPELAGQKEKLLKAKRIANPGCHASGFIALVQPLVAAGVLVADAHLSCFSLTGYSGGGKKMIAQYESDGRDALLDAPRMYGLTQNHKHLPEMAKVCGLTAYPVFCPVVADYLVGMEVVVSVFADQVAGGVQAIREAYKTAYDPALGGVVSFVETADEEGFLAANAWADCDTMQVTVEGNDERILLVSRFDNLGKGASGAAIQNMNIVLGLPETAGLVIR
ncbi:MAG: N-acetyl-gamma-glutamyl-phosphate reductase [Lachnospiraceae bacterium]|nr:N-acetyl-gamma-glutamyl-phosphate reductase [Lachnospiraceae bacterium]